MPFPGPGRGIAGPEYPDAEPFPHAPESPESPPSSASADSPEDTAVGRTPVRRFFGWSQLLFILGTVLCVLVFLVVYRVTTPPGPVEAAERHVEDRYDEVSEWLVDLVILDFFLVGELVSEVAESLAERALSYRCAASSQWQTEGAVCQLEASDSWPMEVGVRAQLSVDLRPVRGPLGQRGAEAHGLRFVPGSLVLSGSGLSVSGGFRRGQWTPFPLARPVPTMSLVQVVRIPAVWISYGMPWTSSGAVSLDCRFWPSMFLTFG